MWTDTYIRASRYIFFDTGDGTSQCSTVYSYIKPNRVNIYICICRYTYACLPPPSNSHVKFLFIDFFVPCFI